MKRPLVLTSLFFCCGILFFELKTFPLLILYLFAITVSIALIYWFYGLKSTLILIVVLGLGFYRAKNFEPPKTNFQNTTLELCGIVKYVEQIKNYQKAIVKIIDIKQHSPRENFNTVIYLSNKKKQTTCAGQKIILKGKLLLPQPQRNPGCFDEEKYFKTKHIEYKIFPITVENGDIDNYFYYALDKIKTKISDVYDCIFNIEQAAIVKSIILGDRTQLDDYTSELYKTAGIYHILAISGLHISIIAIMIISMIKYLFKRPVLYAIVILFLFLYCWLTNFNISTIRATIMISIVMLGNLIYRENDLLNSLSIAAIILMILNPYYILDIGFQYSFGAIIGVSTCRSAIERFFSIISIKFPFAKKLFDNQFSKKYLFPSIAISMITCVITAYYFFYITSYSFIANLFVLPTIACVVVTGFLIGIIGLVSLNLASFFSGPIVFLLRFYEIVCKFFLSLPISKILVGHINLTLVILYFICLSLFIYMLSSFGEKFFMAKKYFLCVTFIFMICITLINIFPKSPEIIMLDVGQGDSIFLDCCGTYIIDGGGKKTQEIGNNTGKNILIPFLNYKGKNYIDAIFVTHSDADHILGIIELIGTKKIGKIFLPSKIFQDNLSNELLNQSKKFSIPVEYLSAGDILSTAKSKDKISFSCLYPFENTIPKKNNDTSLVLNTTINNKKLLLTGDIEKNGEQEILQSKLPITTDIIKIAHHGSKTSSTPNFLKKTKAKLAIISSGINNSYGHPSKETLDNLNKLNIPFLNTAKNGAIIIKICKDELKVSGHVDISQNKNLMLHIKQ